MPRQNEFEATVRNASDTAIIDLVGEINSLAEDRLNAAYDEAMRKQPSAVLLNFSGVDYINSTGIALVVSLLARSRKAHHPLLTCGLSEHYQEIFRITRLADFMEMYSDEASALAQTV